MSRRRYIRIHILALGSRFRNWVTIFNQAGDVKLDGLTYQLLHFFHGFGDGHAAGKVRDIGADARGSSLINDGIFAAHGFFNLACLRMLASVLGGKSLLAWPATVTRPGFSGCLNCL